MRIRGVPVPPGHVRLVAAVVTLVLLAVAVAITANLLGLTGSPAPAPATTRTTATISAAAPCDRSGTAPERVRFTRDGREQEAPFNGCGHTEGEQVQIALPPDPTPAYVTAYATTEPPTRNEGPGTVLLLAATAAGAAYTHLLRRRFHTARVQRSGAASPTFR